jgi:hypothetical protein
MLSATSKFTLCAFFCLTAASSAQCQFPDSVRTGYLQDAAEEYWPPKEKEVQAPQYPFKHLPINHHKGFLSAGLQLRETYEYFNDYLWGLGPQDDNGYLLHRVLLQNDFRWNRHLRIFNEIQSSTLSFRNGGPRPVQDLNKLAFNQLFAELSIAVNKKSLLKLRLGKQSLNYGEGTLLDLRDANVRRSFTGLKLILEKKVLKVDVFLMELSEVKDGIFDDRRNVAQKIGGIWATRKLISPLLHRMDLYYLLTDRQQARFNTGSGREIRHTIGTAFTLQKANWYSYSEMDFQWGTFTGATILAWKIAPSISYQVKTGKLQPLFSIQAAISSGDKQEGDGTLQTFNPIYPKAIYYGYMENAGSANLLMLHAKTAFRLSGHFKMVTGYYRFWRQQTGDGIYAVNGAFLLPAANDAKPVGWMWDMLVEYQVNNHLTFHLIGSYYQRDKYLLLQSITSKNIRYAGVRATFRI